MADAAHAGSFEHEIFSKPFKVEPQFEYYKTPPNYIHKFDGKPPLIRRVSSHRWNAIRLAVLINRITDKTFFSSTFSPELMEQYKGDPNGLAQYYKDDFELIYRDKVFLIDNELKSLGIKSNRQTGTLEKLISLLEDQKKADTARLLLTRYTTESFQNAEQWRSWFESNKDRIFFSDVGGYKFFVIPKGYLGEKEIKKD